jgi:hypothetical protein
MNIRGTVESVTGLVSSITDAGLKVAVALLVVDVIYPGSTGLAQNLGAVVSQFGENGMAGIIALFLFATLYKK